MERELILEELQRIFKTQTELDFFMSTPNKWFHHQCPADCLRNGSFHVFWDLLNQNDKQELSS